MKRNRIALVLALCLLFSLLAPRAAAEETEQALRVELLIPAMKEFFSGAEGDYGAVNGNDNGALSVGLLQWHGSRALELCRRILSRYPAAGERYLSAALRREILNSATGWSRRTLSASERTALSGLLGSAEGRAVQDDLAAENITEYLQAAWRAGMRTDATAFYYATIYNQFGIGGAKTYLERIRATMGVGEDFLFYDLEALHAAVHDTAYGRSALGQRDKTYAFLQDLAWLSHGTPEDPCPGAAFFDMPPAGDWTHESLDRALALGLLKGVGGGRLQPRGTVSRAMAVTLLHRLAGTPQAEGSGGFEDVADGCWYSDAVAWAAQLGVVRGVAPGRFAPDAPVTREQLAVMLYRLTRLQARAAEGQRGPMSSALLPQILRSPQGPALEDYPDAPAVSPFALSAMDWAVGTGILPGTGSRVPVLLEPRRGAARAEATVFLMAWLDAVTAGD